MAQVAHIKDHTSAYHQKIDTQMLWIKGSSLELNISKTEDLSCGLMDK